MTIPNDPESDGIPDVADDTSTAYDVHDRPRFEDSPVALPGDDDWVAVDDYGVTPEESRRDEPMNARLVRERRDVSPDDWETAADDVLADEAVSEEELAQAARDADAWGISEPEDINRPLPREVGRVVELDEGFGEDDEAESIAYDSGEIEGLSAEEAAMHEVPDEDVPYD
jgi:hypothetical protein